MRLMAFDVRRFLFGYQIHDIGRDKNNQASDAVYPDGGDGFHFLLSFLREWRAITYEAAFSHILIPGVGENF